MDSLLCQHQPEALERWQSEKIYGLRVNGKNDGVRLIEGTVSSGRLHRGNSPVYGPKTDQSPRAFLTVVVLHGSYLPVPP